MLTSRPFRGPEDHDDVMQFLAGRHSSPPWIPPVPYWRTGKSRMGIYLTMYEGRRENHQLWTDENGRIQAYAYLSPDENTPIYFTPDVREWRIFIHPDYWSDEHLSHLIGDAESRLNQRTSPEPITTVGYESDWATKSILEANGYVKKEVVDVYMIRPVNQPIPSPVVPEGFVVRPFAGEVEIDSRAILTNSAFGGFEEVNNWSVNNIRNMMRFCQTDEAIDFVAATQDGLIASSGVALVDRNTQLGEFDPVGTRRDYWKKGLAKALLLTGLHWLKGTGMTTAVVRTEADNIPAQRAYESIGFRTVDWLYRYEKRVR